MSAPASPPIWQTCRARDGMTPKQTALVDAIDALGCLADPVGSLSTGEAARTVGCSVESAWHALRSLDWLTVHTPSGCVVDEDALPIEVREQSHWSLPEDPYTDDDDWYRFRIEASGRLGRVDAVEFWRTERGDPPCSYLGKCNSSRCPRHGAES